MLLLEERRFPHCVGYGRGKILGPLTDDYELVVCWRVLSDEEPCDVESSMIAEFRKQHDGKRPFANRRD